MELSQFQYQTNIRGTTYIVTIASSESAKETYETLVREGIRKESTELKDDDSDSQIAV